MSATIDAMSVAPLRRVKRVQFGILSPEEIKSMSVCEIVAPETYEDGRPKQGGLCDPRMGAIDRNTRCATCSGTVKECPGHFGYMELARPVYHVGFINKVMQILRCICFNCGKLLVPANSPAVQAIIRDTPGNMKARLRRIKKLCERQVMCGRGHMIASKQNGGGNNMDEEEDAEVSHNSVPEIKDSGCGRYQPKFRRNQEEGCRLQLLLEYSPERMNKEDIDSNMERRQQLRAATVYELFKQISDEDCRALGLDPKFSRPEWLVITRLPVPPLAVRPAVEMGDGGQKSHDDLTFELQNILKASLTIRENERSGAAPHVIDEQVEYMQFRVAAMVENAMPHMPQSLQRSGRPTKSISDRIKGKAGRLRGNLMGKRVDFSARTVITPDPNLSIDQVGVPRSVAMTLTYPEMVTNFNIDRLRALVKNGPDQHPGARYIIRDDGRRQNLEYATSNMDTHLQPGFVVERHINDNDVIIFNRQPTLHKMSMMGHRIKVLPWSTFRMNLSVTSPYNADFDGDEMNLHVPQSLRSRAEIEEMMMVHKNILTPQANKPCMGIVQDTLCAARKITLRDCFIEKKDVMHLLMWLPGWDGKLPVPAVLKPKQLWTGKQIISMVIPDGVNCVKYHSVHNDAVDQADRHLTVHDTRVLVENGVLISGILCKKSLGSSEGGLLHISFKERGEDVCRRFYGDLQTVINNWLLINGHSVGIGDAIADDATKARILQVKQEAQAHVADVIRDAQNNLIKMDPGLSLRETFEVRVNKILNSAREDAGKDTERSLSVHNNFTAMTISGSKGSKTNISQIVACVAQQNVEGKRIPFGFRYRTLPHFLKDDYSPDARGFVFNSYLVGLSPQEFFFHAMGGREGLIDTAVKTATTGYIQRRLIKSMEGLTLHYDGSVRNSNGDMVQLRYGEDGMDGALVESQKLATVAPSHAKFEAQYNNLVDADHMMRYLEPQVAQEICADPSAAQMLHEEFVQLSKDREMLRLNFPRGDANVVLPVNLNRLIWNAQKQFNIDARTKSDMSPLHVIERVHDVSERLMVVVGDDPLSVVGQYNATIHFKSHLRSMLASKRVMTEHHLTSQALEWMLGEVEHRFMQAQAQPGEMVGPLAAQSMGQPITQMTLNTFHLAGASSGKGVTAGVPRLQEIINVSKNPKTPSLTVYLDPEVAQDEDATMKVFNTIEHATLRSLTASTSIYYDPDDENSVLPEDNMLLALYRDLEEADEAHKFSPWLLRLELDWDVVQFKDVSMTSIEQMIEEHYGDDLKCKFSSDNMSKLVFRIRYKLPEQEGLDKDTLEDDEKFLRQIENDMLDQTLLGIPAISKVYKNKPDKSSDKITVVQGEDGSFVQRQDLVLETDGSALMPVLAEQHVDQHRTVTNNVFEAWDHLGIEAARKLIENEIVAVIKGGNSYVNYRHLSLLCDIMCTQGYLMAITRHGVNKQNTGPLMRASFEQTVDILMEAAAHAECDHLEGVSENIILGQHAPAGTGFFDIVLDKKMMADVVPSNMSTDDDLFAQGMPMPGDEGDQTPWGQQNTPAWNPAAQSP
eukprot:UC1_evm1s1294